MVPALCTVINDQHLKVKEAAREAINKVRGGMTTAFEGESFEIPCIHRVCIYIYYERS